MQNAEAIETSFLRSRWVPALLIGLILVVLAGVVAVTTWQLRQRIREQIAGRDGEVLYAVALLHFREDIEAGLADPVTDAGNQLSVVLKTAQLRGVLGVRLFNAEGKFVESFPFDMTEQDLETKHLATLQRLKYVSQFHPQSKVEDNFLLPLSATGTNEPILEVIVPLHAEQQPLTGIAQFLIEGHSIAAEYARLDRRLLWQSCLALATGGSILAFTLSWAFRRLRRTHRLLTERTENLVKANQELALAAKTSALGAVTAHLLHGLKNPLAGLQSFVASRHSTPTNETELEWHQAVASTQRMQAMINQVIGVLREEQSGAAYEVTLTELEQIVRGRVQPVARKRGVNFTTALQTTATLPNRAANLVALILVNLAENAIHATPRDKTVVLGVCRDESQLRFEVRDEGGGFPADTPLFMPCRSARETGSGIGLALSKQLANHLGAELELVSSASTGCVFALRLPLAMVRERATTAAGIR